MHFVLFYALLCTTFVSVRGWGGEGHGIIARLAQTQLSDSVAGWVRELVPWHSNGSLNYMASWADTIIHENSNPTGSANWQWSRPLHYINTPDWNCSYVAERDCRNDICIDGAVRNYTDRLGKESDMTQQKEALYFLTHFVGDIHQPLHIGFRSDYGGNTVEGRFMNIATKTNLHSLWDSGILRYRMQLDFQSNLTLYYNHIYQLMLRRPASPSDDDLQQWIRESLGFVCSQIYFDDQNRIMNSTWQFRLNDTYYRRSIDVIEQRLADGGRRLGALLNRIGQSRAVPVTQTFRLITVYIIIAVLCVVVIAAVVLTIVLCICCRNRPR